MNQHICFKGLTDTAPPESLEIDSKRSSCLAVFIQLGLNNVLYMYVYIYIYVYEAIHKIQDLSFGNSGVPTIINMQWKGKSQWLPAHIGHLSFFWKASTVAWEQYTVVETKLWLLHAWWDGLPWAVSIAPCTVFSPVPNGMCSSSVPIRCSLNTKITLQILKCVLHPCSI